MPMSDFFVICKRQAFVHSFGYLMLAMDFDLNNIIITMTFRCHLHLCMLSIATNSIVSNARLHFL